MSIDSSKKSGGQADHEKPWYSRFLGSWGIISGSIIGFTALLGPWYLLAPFLEWWFPRLAVSTNFKLSLAQIIVLPISFGLLWLAIMLYGKKLRDIGFTRVRWRYARTAIVGFAAYFAASYLLAVIASLVLNFDQNQPQNLGYSTLGGNLLELVAAFIPLVILTPLLEESVFRGFIFAGFRRTFSFWPAAICVSLLFGLAHGQWNVGIDVFALSMVNCYLREHTKSLWPSIFLHAIKNAVAFYLLYLYNGH